jgi:hypothetical protein
VVHAVGQYHVQLLLLWALSTWAGTPPDLEVSKEKEQVSLIDLIHFFLEETIVKHTVTDS